MYIINKGFIVWSVAILLFTVVICYLSYRNLIFVGKARRPRLSYKQVAFDLLAGIAAFIGFIIMLIGCTTELAEGITFLVFQRQDANMLCVFLSVCFTIIINMVYFFIVHELTVLIQKKRLQYARGRQYSKSIATLASRPRKVKIMS